MTRSELTLTEARRTTRSPDPVADRDHLTQLLTAAGWPRADGRIHATVGVYERASETVGRDTLRQANETVDAAARSDKAFAILLLKDRPRWGVVHNYSMGTVVIASKDGDGINTLARGWAALLRH